MKTEDYSDSIGATGCGTVVMKIENLLSEKTGKATNGEIIDAILDPLGASDEIKLAVSILVYLMTQD